MRGEIDSRTIPDPTIPGLSWRVTLDQDYDITAPDGDGYTATQRAAFGRDWYYVTVGVTPVIGGCELDGATQYLSAVEYGKYTVTDEDDTVTGTVYLDLDSMINGQVDDGDAGYPVPDMIAEAKAELAKLAPVFAAVLAQVAAG